MLITPAKRRDFLILPDGRRLAWHEWGPLDGNPLLFCTGAGMSGSLGFGTDSLDALGIRLISIDRPGLGTSDLHPTKTLATWADDVRALVETRDLPAPVALGFSQGAPFALALGATGIVRAVVLVSGQDDLGFSVLRPLLHPEVAGMVDSARSNPAAFEAYFAGIASAEVLWSLIQGMSSAHDRTVYENPEFAAAYRRCLMEGFVQGPAGYARDLVNTVLPWPFAPEEVTVPAHLWYGRLDTSTVHSPDFGATLASRLPNAARTVLDNEGGSLLWTRSHDILATIRSLS